MISNKVLCMSIMYSLKILNKNQNQMRDILLIESVNRWIINRKRCENYLIHIRFSSFNYCWKWNRNVAAQALVYSKMDIKIADLPSAICLRAVAYVDITFYNLAHGTFYAEIQVHFHPGLHTNWPFSQEEYDNVASMATDGKIGNTNILYLSDCDCRQISIFRLWKMQARSGIKFQDVNFRVPTIFSFSSPFFGYDPKILPWNWPR